MTKIMVSNVLQRCVRGVWRPLCPTRLAVSDAGENLSPGNTTPITWDFIE